MIGLQIAILALFIISLTPLLGGYMASVFKGEATFAHPLLGWLERLSYRLGGVDANAEMNCKAYLKALFSFNLLGFLALFLLLILQPWLPLNPQHLPSVPGLLAFNTAASFVTNTNWQAYGGETTLSYLTQMAGLSVQNFLSAATGLSVLMALTRGFIRKNAETIGNFWVDLIRSVVYVLLPLSIVLAVLLLAGGVIQTFSPYREVTTLENAKQTIPLGPVASQVAIKQLGTNGGGFFNANSAHPFENPSAMTNFLEMAAILLIPAASVYMFGLMIGSKRHGWLLFIVMGIFWLYAVAFSFFAEHKRNPVLGVYPVLEGQETRFGAANSILWLVSTTDTANGSLNAMISSLSPLTGGVAMFNIMLGEVIFGGVGVGLASMLMFVLLTVFLAGLMVGRTPEYLGKKIEKREIQWVMVAVLTPTALILIGSGISCLIPAALSSLGNKGPHGLSEIIYAFSSCSGNNGSAFAGLNANTPYYNLTLGCVMLLARSAIIGPSIALAGILAHKRATPPSRGTFSTDSSLFAVLLIGVIIIVGALSFFPALALGPVVEHLLMLANRSF